MAPKYLSTEEKVRQKLSQQVGKTLLKRKISISTDAKHEFDGVSQDEEILVEIKASGIPGKGEIRHTQLAEMCEACLLLLSVKNGRRRILALSNQDFYKKFANTMQAEAARSLGVEILLVVVE